MFFEIGILLVAAFIIGKVVYDVRAGEPVVTEENQGVIL